MNSMEISKALEDGSRWGILSDYKKAEKTYAALRENIVTDLEIILNDEKFLKRRRVFPVHYAVEEEKIATLETIFKVGYDIDKIVSFVGSALHVAITRRKYAIARWLIVRGARLTPRNMKGENALSLAAQYGDMAFIKFVFRKSRSVVPKSFANARYGRNHMTLLGLLCENYRIKNGSAYKQLLLLGANINKTVALNLKFNESSIILIRIAEAGDNKITAEVLADVLKLQKRGRLCGCFRPNAQDQNKNTLLHVLIMRGAFKAFKMLLEVPEIDLNILGKGDRTPLNCAIEEGRLVMIKILLNRGCNVWIKSLWCEVYPFDHAIYEHAYKAARMIVIAGFKISNSDEFNEIKNEEWLSDLLKLEDQPILSLYDMTCKCIRQSLLNNGFILTKANVEKTGLPTKLSINLSNPFFPIAADGVQNRQKGKQRGKAMEGTRQGN